MGNNVVLWVMEKPRGRENTTQQRQPADNSYVENQP